MPVLSVRHIEQFEEYFCGAAVAQMILDSCGVGPPAPGMTDEEWQRSLWADVEAQTTGPPRPPQSSSAPSYIDDFDRQQCVLCTASDWNCWAATPQALSAIINLHVSKAPDEVVVVGLKAEDEAMGAVLRSIDHGAAAAVLVGNGDHWIVVRGYKSGHKTPPPVPVLNQQLNGVYVRDPQDPAPKRLIPADEWMNSWFFPVTCGVPSDQDRYVAVVGQAAVKGAPTVKRPPTKEADGIQPLLNPAAIVTIAEQHALELLEDDEEPQWQVALSHAGAGEPQLVQRLDRNDDFYFVVPFLKGRVITARLAVDAKTGRLKEVGGIEEPSQSLLVWQMAEAFLERHRDQILELPKGRLVVRKEAVGVHPILVWKPCLQSRSPLLPFALLTIGGVQVYQRVDGKIFTNLTGGGKGR